ncbi:MAG: 4-hydroxythreonine-4-phosphate dehydrogenase PdxA [Hydrogenophaga sp.]|uniref:PdxA family dehydrogenase n=1 Tax=Hydrogenophaga TaxID=47420 RepID=UPI001B384BD7|nr:4-hydroxythreonine-4-phosphate dehydrogenase PdxA [Hydrogenophaga sp.]MBQ0918822.1 4-hydroxythreonine-4-phosphate dehydrogenase PdxA [Hydrogenophaga aromaticivorans]MDO9481670.1 4-hydroxythreonine-4-phosphate dehydrogenase PdxA [Hydrogenophaga sp.]MDP2219365.1 4-hydroxythreonine-4-phosphate dehydrogenase PdxA [Hydrogenophaga sp.]MDP3345541.1 4-hydroxythreonine-4-phosphate dehydrogenase PdxA [Hydrogenophaga sp.]MDP3926699.1 4-hydroxythreonine-4-phosphate dehydrogenase PdxA [Hydrogenophaga sp
MTLRVVSRIAIPIGDPNGIGPEIALKTVAAYSGREDVALTLFGPERVLQRTADALGLAGVLAAATVEPTAPVLQDGFKPGEVNAYAGAAAIDAATRAIEAARRGRFDAVVAAPHHETAIAKAGIAFSGYPSLVARVCGQPEDSVFLLLIGGGLRIVHATLHESVQHALGRLSPELVADAARAGARALTQLGIQTPRIALMGINPHAGEGGLFGKEDVVITEPAAAQLRAQGFDVTGPAGGDMLLASRSHDLYVAIFHDQGHIPVKVLSPQRASAVSIGADVLLSSVGHGSAMDIAGKGVASARAMIETVAMLGQVTAPPTTEGNAQ